MTTEKLTMPTREPKDGAVEVRREDGGIRLRAEFDGCSHSMWCSEHNAWRLFAMLALILEIPLPAKVGKAIKL